jgi:hypothetical protein
MITPQAKMDLLNDPKVQGTNIFQQLTDYKDGQVAKIMGFDVMVRSTVLTYNAAGSSAKLPDAAGLLLTVRQIYSGILYL